MSKGRLFVAGGTLLAAIAAIVLVLALPSAFHLLFSDVQLVQYAQFMVEAQLVVHSILFVMLLVSAAFLIRQGKRLLRGTSGGLPSRTG